MKPSWGEQWNTGWWFGTFLFFHSVGNNHPNWLSYFSEGLKPPTSVYLLENYTHMLHVWYIYLHLIVTPLPACSCHIRQEGKLSRSGQPLWRGAPDWLLFRLHPERTAICIWLHSFACALFVIGMADLEGGHTSGDDAADAVASSKRVSAKQQQKEPLVMTRRRKYEMWCDDNDELLQYCLGQPGFLKLEQEEASGLLENPSECLQTELDCTNNQPRKRRTLVGLNKTMCRCHGFWFCILGYSRYNYS